MKLKLPLLFFLILSTGYCYAISFSDSLQTVLNSGVHDSVKARACKELVSYYRGIDFEKSIYYGNKGLKYAESIKHDDLIAGFDKELGITYYLNGNRQLALQFFNKAVKQYESHNNKNGAAGIYLDVSNLLRRQRDYELAVSYLNNAIDLYNSNSDLNGVANSYNTLGQVYEAREKTDSALAWYQKALELYESNKNDLGVSYSLNYIAGVYINRREYDKALESLNKSLNLRLHLNDNEALCQSYTSLGECYEGRGDYALSLYYFKMSIDLAKSAGLLDVLQYNYEQAANIYQQTGSYKEALEYYSLFQSLKDSIYNNSRSQQIEEMKAKYENDKREQKLALAKNENALKDLELRRKNILLSIGVGLIIITVLVSLLLYNRYKWKKEAEISASQMQHQELTAKAVIDTEERERRRIASDLHDGIGQMLSAAKMNMSALNNEIHFTKNEQKHFFDRTQDIIDECCREVRTMSHQMMPNVLLKNGLASAVREFVNKVDSSRLKVNLQTHGLSERLDDTVETVLYRVIQECVNNVIKHSNADHLDIQIISDHKEISVTVEDNGKGFDLKNIENGDGIGLRNIRTRVEYLKGGVHIDSRPGRGTLVHVEIPLGNNR
jgi:two-component system NarL family sensor kinase